MALQEEEGRNAFHLAVKRDHRHARSVIHTELGPSSISVDSSSPEAVAQWQKSDQPTGCPSSISDSAALALFSTSSAPNATQHINFNIPLFNRAQDSARKLSFTHTSYCWSQHTQHTKAEGVLRTHLSTHHPNHRHCTNQAMLAVFLVSNQLHDSHQNLLLLAYVSQNLSLSRTVALGLITTPLLKKTLPLYLSP